MHGNLNVLSKLCRKQATKTSVEVTSRLSWIASYLTIPSWTCQWCQKKSTQPNSNLVNYLTNHMESRLQLKGGLLYYGHQPKMHECLRKGIRNLTCEQMFASFQCMSFRIQAIIEKQKIYKNTTRLFFRTHEKPLHASPTLERKITKSSMIYYTSIKLNHRSPYWIKIHSVFIWVSINQ